MPRYDMKYTLKGETAKIVRTVLEGTGFSKKINASQIHVRVEEPIHGESTIYAALQSEPTGDELLDKTVVLFDIDLLSSEAKRIDHLVKLSINSGIVKSYLEAIVYSALFAYIAIVSETLRKNNEVDTEEPSHNREDLISALDKPLLNENILNATLSFINILAGSVPDSDCIDKLIGFISNPTDAHGSARMKIGGYNLEHSEGNLPIVKVTGKPWLYILESSGLVRLDGKIIKCNSNVVKALVYALTQLKGGPKSKAREFFDSKEMLKAIDPESSLNMRDIFRGTKLWPEDGNNRIVKKYRSQDGASHISKYYLDIDLTRSRVE